MPRRCYALAALLFVVLSTQAVRGDQVIADSIADFALANGMQGNANWFYGYHNATANGAYDGGSKFIPFHVDQGAGISATDFWTGTSWDWGGPGGNPPWTNMGSQNQHPTVSGGQGVHWTVRRYQIPEPGSNQVLAGVDIDYQTFDAQIGSGNGVISRIFIGGVEVATHTIADGNAVGFSGSFTGLNLAPGTFIDFVVDPNGNDSFDNTHFSALITTNFETLLTPEPTSQVLFGLVMVGVAGAAWWRRRRVAA